MAQRSWMWDSVDGDRVNSSADLARLTSSLSTNGVVSGHGDELQVQATSPESLAVQVATGRAFVEGRWFEVHSEPETVTLDTAHATNPRIDRIVVRRHLANRTVEVGKITGTPAVSPTPPSLTRDAGGIWEDPLRQVFVRANATAIRASDQGDGQGYVSADERSYARSMLAPGRGPRGLVVPPANHTSVTTNIATLSGATLLTLTGVPVIAGRRYRLSCHGRFDTAGSGSWGLHMGLHVNGASRDAAWRLIPTTATDVTIERVGCQTVVTATSTSTWSVEMVLIRTQGAFGDTRVRGSSNAPAQLYVEDVGAV